MNAKVRRAIRQFALPNKLGPEPPVPDKLLGITPFGVIVWLKALVAERDQLRAKLRERGETKT